MGVDEIKHVVMSDASMEEHVMFTEHSQNSQRQAHPGGRPPAFKPKYIAVLHDIATKRAQKSLQEIADELHQRSGICVCAATICRALRLQGIARLEMVRRADTAAKPAGRYGCTAAHRRDGFYPYSTNLTSAE